MRQHMICWYLSHQSPSSRTLKANIHFYHWRVQYFFKCLSNYALGRCYKLMLHNHIIIACLHYLLMFVWFLEFLHRTPGVGLPNELFVRKGCTISAVGWVWFFSKTIRNLDPDLIYLLLLRLDVYDLVYRCQGIIYALLKIFKGTLRVLPLTTIQMHA